MFQDLKRRVGSPQHRAFVEGMRPGRTALITFACCCLAIGAILCFVPRSELGFMLPIAGIGLFTATIFSFWVFLSQSAVKEKGRRLLRSFDQKPAQDAERTL